MNIMCPPNSNKIIMMSHHLHNQQKQYQYNSHHRRLFHQAPMCETYNNVAATRFSLNNGNNYNNNSKKRSQYTSDIYYDFDDNDDDYYEAGMNNSSSSSNKRIKWNDDEGRLQQEVQWQPKPIASWPTFSLHSLMSNAASTATNNMNREHQTSSLSSSSLLRKSNSRCYDNKHDNRSYDFYPPKTAATLRHDPSRLHYLRQYHRQARINRIDVLLDRLETRKRKMDTLLQQYEHKYFSTGTGDDNENDQAAVVQSLPRIATTTCWKSRQTTNDGTLKSVQRQRRQQHQPKHKQVHFNDNVDVILSELAGCNDANDKWYNRRDYEQFRNECIGIVNRYQRITRDNSIRSPPDHHHSVVSSSSSDHDEIAGLERHALLPRQLVAIQRLRRKQHILWIIHKHQEQYNSSFNKYNHHRHYQRQLRQQQQQQQQQQQRHQHRQEDEPLLVSDDDDDDDSDDTSTSSGLMELRNISEIFSSPSAKRAHLTAVLNHMAVMVQHQHEQHDGFNNHEPSNK